MKPTRKFVNRPRRYPVNDNFVVRVTIEQASTNEPLSVNARLLDLSPGGAKLSLISPIRFDEAMTLSLHSDELNLHLSISARVCWIRQQDETCWVVGCAFEPRLPDDELERMFAHGLLERRREQRDSVRGQAIAKWELHPDETPVGLLDLSAGGFSVLSPFAAQIGTHLQMALESACGTKRVDVLANVHWQLQVEGGYVFGCGFDNSQTYGAMKSCLFPEGECPLGLSKSAAWSLMGVAVVTLFALAYCFWQMLG